MKKSTSQKSLLVSLIFPDLQNPFVSSAKEQFWLMKRGSIARNFMILIICKWDVLRQYVFNSISVRSKKSNCYFYNLFYYNTGSFHGSEKMQRNILPRAEETMRGLVGVHSRGTSWNFLDYIPMQHSDGARPHERIRRAVSAALIATRKLVRVAHILGVLVPSA